MSDTLVTVTGNVATMPELRTASTGAQFARFRLAATERRFDRATERWTDAHTNFFTVWAWRGLGENVAASVGVGDPVVVQGRLRVTEREDKGQPFVSAAIDAAVVGHDLNRGTSAFRRVVKARGDWTSDPFAAPPESPGRTPAAPDWASPPTDPTLPTPAPALTAAAPPAPASTAPSAPVPSAPSAPAGSPAAPEPTVPLYDESAPAAPSPRRAARRRTPAPDLVAS